ncbi:MAG: hypothetical protein IJF73_06640 [Clostridia bacterium]|nr:hypothetical protein [Clostridia bacterium]
MKKKLLLAAFLLLALGCLLLTACGGGQTADLKFEGATYTYDGQAKTVAVTGLPEGAVVKYSINGGAAVDAVALTNAGTYDVVAKITMPEGYAEASDMRATLTINKGAAVAMNGVSFTGGEYTYDGAFHGPTLNGTLPEGVGYVITSGELVRNAGESATFTIAFVYTDPDMANNLAAPASVSGITVSVKKAEIDMSGVTFEDAAVPFDNQHHSLAIGGTLPSLLEVRYEGGRVGKGTTEVKAIFSFRNEADAANYVLPAPMTANLTVGPGEFDLSYANFVDQTLYYNGLDQAPDFGNVEGLLATVKAYRVIEGFGTIPTDVVKTPGVYKLTAEFAFAEGYSAEDFILPDAREITVIVEKAPLTGLKAPTWAPGAGWVSIDKSGYFLYNGSEFTVGLVGMPENSEEYTITYTLTGHVNSVAGIHTASATFAIDSEYYVLPEGYGVADYTYMIAAAEIDTTKINLADLTVTYDGEGHKIVLSYAENYDVLKLGIAGVEIKIYDATGADVTDNEGEGFVNVGTYTYVVKLTGDVAKGYAPAIIGATLTIEKKEISLDGIDVSWILDDADAITDGEYLTADGSAHTVTLSAETKAALEEVGFKVTSYTGNVSTEPGEYTATVTFTCDENHVIAEGDETVTLSWAIADGDPWTDETEK